MIYRFDHFDKVGKPTNAESSVPVAQFSAAGRANPNDMVVVVQSKNPPNSYSELECSKPMGPNYIVIEGYLTSGNGCRINDNMQEK